MSQAEIRNTHRVRCPLRCLLDTLKIEIPFGIFARISKIPKRYFL